MRLLFFIVVIIASIIILKYILKLVGINITINKTTHTTIINGEVVEHTVNGKNKMKKK